MFNYLRFRYRRMLRRAKRNSRLLRKWTVNYINRHIWGKWHQLGVVRRFLLVWLGLTAVAFAGLTNELNMLSRATQVSVPSPGGTYTEAAVGTVKVLNPVLPESTTSNDMNALIFNGLTRYNAKRQVVPDLATSWDISADGRTYTFHLRHGVKWHDGVPFSAADVAFTLTAIQNPDSRSPLASSWQGVKTDMRGNDTVVFTLPTPLTSFLDSTTLPIVPRHMLESVEPSQLREATFNQHPVGTGPFKIKTFAPAAHEVTLEANPDYYAGRPQLDEFTFRLYDTPTEALDAYAKHQVISPGRIRPEQQPRREQFADLTDYNFTLPEETTLFFQTADPRLADKSLRQILTGAVDRKAVIKQATDGQALAVSQPILPGQVGYTTSYALKQQTLTASRQALEDAGWKIGRGGVREKDDQKLSFKLITLAGGELEQAARSLKSQWAPLGVELQVQAVDSTTLQQTYMRPRNFQMLLFGINIGADSDVYSFWHSSQAKDPGLNLSGYNSSAADVALEAGRIKTDTDIRKGKYDAFLKAWDDDAPAVVLYETNYEYAANDQVGGITPGRLVEPSDRYSNVEHWTVKRQWIQAGR